jgi:hypothetical protein
VPAAAIRQRRGPKPSDATLAKLARALEAALRHHRHLDAGTDAPEAPRRLGRAWLAALAAAAVSLGKQARRGVVAALAGAGAAALAAATVPAPIASGWAGDVTGELENEAQRQRARGAAPAALLAALLALLGNRVMSLFSFLVEALARAAGANRYVWTTRGDDRVRHLHVELDGTIQRWDTPPLAGLPDFHGHPGEAAHCRCTAYPVVG